MAFNIQNLIDDAASAPTSLDTLAEYMSYEKHLYELRNADQNMGERKIYAESIYLLTCIWCIFLGIIIVAEGNGSLNYSENVMITLITSTTVNVLFFFRYVTKYLFNSTKST